MSSPAQPLGDDWKAISPSLPSTWGFVRRHPIYFEAVVEPETLQDYVRTRPDIAVDRAVIEGHTDGSAEPWIADLLCALLVACDARVVLECGGFHGDTSTKLATTLAARHGGELIIAELEHDRATYIQRRLEALDPLGVEWRVMQDDVLRVIQKLPDASLGFVWVDDDHTKDHVTTEIEALWPKMQNNGLICGHDVFGVCDLQAVFKQFGGYALDLPRLGPAGGLGILQVRA